MAESDVLRTDNDAQALLELSTLLERVLDEGAVAFALRYHSYSGWEILVGDPEGPASGLTHCGVLAEEVALALFGQTVDGLNLLVINGDPYRFARAKFRIGEALATIFVPG
jgi:hypothetical protein